METFWSQSDLERMIAVDQDEIEREYIIYRIELETRFPVFFSFVMQWLSGKNKVFSTRAAAWGKKIMDFHPFPMLFPQNVPARRPG